MFVRDLGFGRLVVTWVVGGGVGTRRDGGSNSYEEVAWLIAYLCCLVYFSGITQS